MIKARLTRELLEFISEKNLHWVDLQPPSYEDTENNRLYVGVFMDKFNSLKVMTIDNTKIPCVSTKRIKNFVNKIQTIQRGD